MSDGVRSADFFINASALCRSCHSRPRELDIVYIRGYTTSFPGFSPTRQSDREKDPGWVCSRGFRTKLILREEPFVPQFCVSSTQ